MSRRFISKWIHRYNEQGLEVLKYRHTGGKKEVWNIKYFKELFEELYSTPKVKTKKVKVKIPCQLSYFYINISLFSINIFDKKV